MLLSAANDAYFSFYCLHFKKSQQVYDLDRNKYCTDEVVQMYMDVTEKFKREHPLFVGSKAIYAKTKVPKDEIIAAYFDTFRRLHKKFPQFVVGFDLVGHEVMYSYRQN